ncbi:MAG: MarR family transcriptional regulator [Candidatus Lokiarchaeota archaeon]|nr:MarR family transcriptional regulator [Candidatus Lokiarchaeota archaeon]
MIFTKGLVVLAQNSKLCNEFLNKNHLILISLIGEKLGLRVTDIHQVVQGNKSWISNILFKLESNGLVSRKKNGREVFYKLTEKGEKLSFLASKILEKLLIQEGIEYNIIENSYWIYKEELEDKNSSDYLSNIRPVHEYEGEVLSTSNYFIFIGKSISRNKLILIKINFDKIKEIDYEFDEFYKRRFAITQKPIKITFQNQFNFHSIYLITNWTKSPIFLKSAISIRKHKKLHEFLLKNTGG